MDPITHGVIGLGISALSGQPITFANPIVIGSVIGAMSPDIDIIAKHKGDYAYLKHHRGISHSIPGLITLAGAISLLLNLIFKDYSFTHIFIWTFLGCLSHSVFDMLNSYGVRILLPFNKKKLAMNLLMLYDPFIIILSFGLVVFKGDVKLKAILAATSLLVYLCFRQAMKIKARKLLKNKYSKYYKIKKISVLPGLINPLKWDFIIEAKHHSVVGEINYLNNKIKIKKKLRKKYTDLIRHIKNTRLGQYFLDFTPITHIRIIERRDKITLHLIDLRYFIRNDFMHHATIILNEDLKVIKEIFHPYNYNNKILISNEEAS
ncbi:metal-dependent hydrolase [Caldisalinibacter kiritimatiensis]|uniref:Membrane-bound metal-dependent hydrolase n=1 Tax=Caldisalinibacter kiritimatiensis TaxID=1304284 RepID=R1AT96_9FIRM|nr:metal-dependent hydrolase [Caldisalinibacter kiritimatiensis]EOC99856.1 membrane-bound metal-dependent hydrolase [Caldisalinibacter kiritimatiensis]